MHILVVVKLLRLTRVVEIAWAVGGVGVVERGHGRVCAGHLKHIIADLDALVAGKLGCDRVDHLRAEVSEATMSIISSIISDEVRLFKLLLHLHLLLNFVHFSGES